MNGTLTWRMTTVISWMYLIFVVQGLSQGSADVFVSDNSAGWGRALYSCFYNNSDLYSPKETKDSITWPGDGVYWLGGAQSLTWKWTSNNEQNLYSEIGYTKTPWLNLTTEHKIEDNNVFDCHMKCSTKYLIFGLQNFSCYCLHNDVRFINETLPDARPCPGNLEENCGNIQDISVYRIANINFEPTAGGQCVYARKLERTVADYYTGLRVGSCDERRGYVHKDQGHITIVDSPLRSWSEANATASGKLLYVTPNDLQELTNEMIFSTNVNDKKREYWIGLRQTESFLLRNGEAVTTDNRPEDNNPRECLAVELSGNTSKTIWRSCSEQHKGICGTASSNNGLANSRAPQNLIWVIGVVLGIVLNVSLSA